MKKEKVDNLEKKVDIEMSAEKEEYAMGVIREFKCRVISAEVMMKVAEGRFKQAKEDLKEILADLKKL